VSNWQLAGQGEEWGQVTDTGGHIEVVRSATRDRARELTRGGRTAVVCSKDRDEACELVAPYFTAHDLDVVGRPADLDVLLRARSTASITIADLRYGTEVVLRPGRILYYKINIPRRGSSLSAIGAVEFESFPGRGAVLPPTEAFTMRWSGNLDLFAVKISTAVVERTVESVLGYPPDEAVRFAVAFDVTSSAGRRWLRSVAMLRDALDEGAPDLVVRPLEELIVGQLLAAQPHNFTDRLDGSPRPARPRVLRRVIECIEADPAAPHTVADLALVVGTCALVAGRVRREPRTQPDGLLASGAAGSCPRRSSGRRVGWWPVRRRHRVPLGVRTRPALRRGLP
jgi:hypothetical protein